MSSYAYQSVASVEIAGDASARLRMRSMGVSESDPGQQVSTPHEVVLMVLLYLFGLSSWCTPTPFEQN